MKKRFVKNLALVMGMTIMATSLAACGFFPLDRIIGRTA